MNIMMVYVAIWYYHFLMSDNLLKLFIEVVNSHLDSSSFSEVEKSSLRNRLSVFEKKYKSNDNIKYSKLFRLCDDVNFITVQVSAHDIEVLAFRLIEIRFQKEIIEKFFFLAVIIACC